MATTQCEVVVSMVCGENLSGDQYELLTINSSGQVVKQTYCRPPTSSSGFWPKSPGTTTAGDRVAVALIGGGGILKCKAGNAITAGQVAHLQTPRTAGRHGKAANIGATGRGREPPSAIAHGSGSRRRDIRVRRADRRGSALGIKLDSLGKGETRTRGGLRMPFTAPGPGDVHVNRPLTNIAIAYMQIGDATSWPDRAFPNLVNVGSKSDSYYHDPARGTSGATR